ncbi:MAG TPA: hypothetical protein VJ739_12050 [Gemmataceae bacterium]|nr:hypothetical protein [Gemmataceae bacterium]
MPAAKRPSQDTRSAGEAPPVGLRITPVAVNAKGLLPCLIWADDGGSAFFAADHDQAVLYRFSGTDYQTKETVHLKAKPSWLARSAEGLIVTIADRGEFRLLDAQTFAVKKNGSIPQLQRVVSAPASAVAVAETSAFGSELVVVDLKTDAQTKIPGPKRLGNLGYGGQPAMAPDGRSVYTNALAGSIVRWTMNGSTLTLAEIGPRMCSGPAYAITISADSRYVAQPFAQGNCEAGQPYGTLILDAALQRHCLVSTGRFSEPLGFDVANNVVYTGSDHHGLVTFDIESGVKKKEYGKFGKGDHKQYLVHPAGKRVVVLQSEALSYVEIEE